jgi:hypothetical protein
VIASFSEFQMSAFTSAFLLCKGIHHGFAEEASQLMDKATKLRQQIIAVYHLL